MFKQPIKILFGNYLSDTEGPFFGVGLPVTNDIDSSKFCDGRDWSLGAVFLCARLFICALWSPAGKGLTSWLSFVVSTVSLSLSHWYPGSGVVLDCIDS